MSAKPPPEPGGQPVRGIWVAAALLGIAALVLVVLVLTSGILAG